MSRAVGSLGIAIALVACIPDEIANTELASSAPIVTTDRGPVRGVIDGELVVFRGIPYARAPRFAPPEQPAAWSTPRDATAFGPRCPQASGGAEDCLCVNVWGHAGGTPRAVIVWIHGGGYVEGAGSLPEYDGAELARSADVVVVTLNYRLGLLGFLALPQLAATDGGTGNWGLRDQLAALEWVHHNIAAFGGDPERVLIAGESAGGASVCTLLAAPAAQGLFQAAAMQSGTCRLVLERERATGALPAAYGVGLASALDLGCTSGDIAACLRGRPIAQLLATQRKLAPSFELGVPIAPTLPVVDGVVLDRRPLAAIRAGRGAVPLIAGSNRDDTSPFITFAEAPGAFATYLATIGQAAYAPQLLALYPPALLGERGAAIAFSTDVAFACPAASLADVRPALGRMYELERPIASGPLVPLGLGAVHGLDYLLLFGTLATWGIDPVPERPLSNAIQQLWGAAARGALPAWWPTTPAYLALDATSHLAAGWRGGRCASLAVLGLLEP